MKDLGSPNLIAKLLVLQRQGEFEKKETSSEIFNAVIKGDDDNVLEFEFLTYKNDIHLLSIKIFIINLYKLINL